MAVVGVFSPRKTMLLEPTAIPGSGVSHNAHATARLLQQLTQAPVAIAAPATEISTAAPAVEVGLTVPGPSGEPVSASTALFTAIANSDVATIERLFAAGASTDVYSPQGTTPLTEAIVKGDPTVINAILTKGVNTNLPTRPQGVTPLTLALQQGNLALAQRLLDAGADINLRDAAGDTVLLQTVKRSPVNYGAVELLLSRRPSPTTSAPDLTATDAQGRTPRQIALASVSFMGEFKAIIILFMQPLYLRN